MDVILDSLLFFITSLAASIAGAVGGVGSGIMVKPILELASHLEIIHTMTAQEISLLSSLAVFTMAFTAFVQRRKNLEGFRFDVAISLAIGSTTGGFIGRAIFDMVGYNLAVAQGVVMIIVMGILLLHQIFESKITPLKLQRVPTYIILGTCLGMIAAFLGIGGGPLNLSSLNFFFSMDLKVAALYSLFVIMFAQGANLGSWWFRDGGWPNVEPHLIIAVVVGSVLGAIIGATLYKKMDAKALKKIYSGVLIFVILISIVNLMLLP